MTTAPTPRLPRLWIIWVGVLLTAVMVVVMLAWWLLLAQPEVVTESMATLDELPFTPTQRQQLDAVRAVQPVSPP